MPFVSYLLYFVVSMARFVVTFNNGLLRKKLEIRRRHNVFFLFLGWPLFCGNQVVILLNLRYHRAQCLTEYTSVLTVREDQEVKQQGVGFGRLQDQMQAINMAVIGEILCVFF